MKEWLNKSNTCPICREKVAFRWNFITKNIKKFNKYSYNFYCVLDWKILKNNKLIVNS